MGKASSFDARGHSDSNVGRNVLSGVLTTVLAAFALSILSLWARAVSRADVEVMIDRQAPQSVRPDIEKIGERLRGLSASLAEVRNTLSVQGVVLVRIEKRLDAGRTAE